MFPLPETRNATFSHFFGNPDFGEALALKRRGGSAMDEDAELATAGLVVAFAAVLLVASHFFIEAQSAKHLARGTIDIKAATNIVAGWL